MPGRQPIIDVTVSGLARALRSLPGLLAIYWLPWLLGTIALLILDVVLLYQLRWGWAPAWARNIVWAPFGTMAFLMLLRWVLNGDAPARSINLDGSREVWMATPIVALWLVAATGVDAAPIAILGWLPYDTFAGRWEEAVPYVLAMQGAAWLIDGALLAVSFGLLAVLAKLGRLDPGGCWRLLRANPVHLFCVCLLSMAAVGGLNNLGSYALWWLGAYDLAPGTLIPWRAYIRQAFLAELPRFPLHFLEFAIQGSIVAEAYRRLLSQPAAPAAGGASLTQDPQP